ncbi:MAG: hypothetical protein JNL72_13985 [Flavipsychrobacter sp.]|nr:hypothetical protein [Flavipsychrobacter sp.]
MKKVIASLQEELGKRDAYFQKHTNADSKAKFVSAISWGLLKVAASIFLFYTAYMVYKGRPLAEIFTNN